MGCFGGVESNGIERSSSSWVSQESSSERPTGAATRTCFVLIRLLLHPWKLALEYGSRHRVRIPIGWLKRLPRSLETVFERLAVRCSRGGHYSHEIIRQRIMPRTFDMDFTSRRRS